MYYEIPIKQPVQYLFSGKHTQTNEEWRHPKRTLSDYELILVSEGTLYLALDKQKYTLSKGDFLFCPPGTLQEGFRSSQTSFFWMHFLGHGRDDTAYPVSSEIRPEKSGDKIRFPVSGSAKSYEKLAIMLKQLQDEHRTYEDNNLNCYLATAILCELYNQYFFSSEVVVRDKKRPQLYLDIVDYVKSYRHTNLKVIDIANFFGYNEKYLSHLFRSVTGVSLKQYILQEKIDLAKYILTETNDTVASIAESLGFEDSHNFMKAFKKIAGLTPTEYRNTYSKRTVLS